MPLYIADYLADTTRLTTEQHGAYMLIIMDYWRNGAPPDDDNVLANITKLTPNAWRKHRVSLSKLFTIDGGEWKHKRIDDELKKASDNATAYANRAKVAAEKRWNKDKISTNQAGENGCLNDATSIPQAMHKDMLGDATSSSPSPSSNIKTHTQSASDEFSPDLEKLNFMLQRSGSKPIDQTQLDQALVTFTPHYELYTLTENQRYGKLVTWLKRDDFSLKAKQTKAQQGDEDHSDRTFFGILKSDVAAQANLGESEYDCAFRLNQEQNKPAEQPPEKPIRKARPAFTSNEDREFKHLVSLNPELTKSVIHERAEREGVPVSSVLYSVKKELESVA